MRPLHSNRVAGTYTAVPNVQNRAGATAGVRRLHAGKLRAPESHIPPSRPPTGTIDSSGRLLTTLLTPEAYLAARRAAETWRVPVYRAAIALGLVTPEAYAHAVARWLGIPLATAGLACEAIPETAADLVARRHGEPPVQLALHGAGVTVFSATSDDPARLAGAIETARWSGAVPVLATEATIVRALEARAASALLGRATRALARLRPDVSASRAVPFRQMLALLLAVGLPLGVLAIYPRQTLGFLAIAAALFFAAVVAVRSAALIEALRPRPARTGRAASIPDAELPVYSVLVPLVDEAEVLGDLVASLSALDYPAAKLDVLLILEERDHKTPAALATRRLPPFMRTVVVPDGPPRTKPKALNYALAFARGAYLVVYDAEDRPEPDQLRSALEAFATGGPDLACVQAPLNIYNARQSWLSKQFALEYSTLFDATLPALDRLAIPLPLGGTSNHFPGIA